MQGKRMTSGLPWWVSVSTLVLLAWMLLVNVKAHPWWTGLLIAVDVVLFVVALRRMARRA